MANAEQTMIMADIRRLKKHEKEQDKRIENLELKESVNGATILKAISDLRKESRENFQTLRKEMNDLHEDNKSLHEDNRSIHEEMKALREDNKSIHEEMKALHEDNKSIHEELQRMNDKFDGKFDLIVELLSKR